MATHWHLDHIGYAGYGGIWSLLEQQGITANVLMDRDGGDLGGFQQRWHL